MLAGAVRTYVNRFGVAPGREAAIFTAGDDGWNTARDLAAAGVKIVAVVDSREQIDPRLRALCESFGAPALFGRQRPRARRAANPCGALRSARRTAASRLWLATCSPFPTAGIRQSILPRIRDIVRFGTPRSTRLSRETCLTACASPGARRVAFRSARRLPTAPGSAPEPRRIAALRRRKASPRHTTDPEAVAVAPVWRVARSRGKAFVDYQNDVTDRDIELAAQEGFRVGRTSQALHHARHGDRSGQDLQSGRSRHHGRTDGQDDRGNRRHDVSSALHAGGDRRARRTSSRAGFPSRAPRADPSMVERAWRGLRRIRPMAARAILSPTRAKRIG